LSLPTSIRPISLRLPSFPYYSRRVPLSSLSTITYLPRYLIAIRLATRTITFCFILGLVPGILNGTISSLLSSLSSTSSLIAANSSLVTHYSDCHLYHAINRSNPSVCYAASMPVPSATSRRRAISTIEIPISCRSRLSS
jgi:hypothetical protein